MGEADRVGGIELMILWPAALGDEPMLGLDCEREASATEKAYAEALVREDCSARGLVPVHVRVVRVRRPQSPRDIERAGKYAAHLAITIIGQRWVHARTSRISRVMFCLGAPSPPVAAPTRDDVDPLASTAAFAQALSAILGETVKPAAASEIKLRPRTIAARALVRLLRMPQQEREDLIARHLRA